MSRMRSVRIPDRSEITNTTRQKETRSVSRSPSAPPTPLSYRPEAAARVLGVSRATIYRMIAKGDLTPRKLGAATVIRHEDLARLLDDPEPSPTT